MRRISNRLSRYFLTVTAASMFLGCDDKRDAIPPVITPPTSAPATSEARPTTQALLTEPRQQISLGGSTFKLQIEIPKSWKLTPVGTSSFLEGLTPHGDVMIQVHMLEFPVKENGMLAMERRARATASSQPATLEVSPLRQVGGTARVMESREILRNISIQRAPDVIEHGNRVDWIVKAFVPLDTDFHVITLTFSGLSLELYQQDREFLDRIIGSIHYDATGGSFPSP